jgi:hypothetical protein
MNAAGCKNPRTIRIFGDLRVSGLCPLFGILNEHHILKIEYFLSQIGVGLQPT